MAENKHREDRVSALQGVDADISRLEIELAQKRALRTSLLAGIDGTHATTSHVLKNSLGEPQDISLEEPTRPVDICSVTPPFAVEVPLHTLSPLRRGEPEDPPVVVPTRLVFTGDEEFVWLRQASGQRVLHVRADLTTGTDESPLWCSMLIWSNDPRLVPVRNVDARQENVLVCATCVRAL